MTSASAAKRMCPDCGGQVTKQGWCRWCLDYTEPDE